MSSSTERTEFTTYNLIINLQFAIVSFCAEREQSDRENEFVLICIHFVYSLSGIGQWMPNTNTTENIVQRFENYANERPQEVKREREKERELTLEIALIELHASRAHGH